ncbi:MAG: hypothetical protein CSA52_03340 [Gammaproteobacteria bacterium]|nr:MAG: hypothetical protein CSB48_04070 [Pseudomonadota bacterium]PIE38228.1 MAG: hypothetical protein CSA52_03340 [Gammaproteobacteria bacterium]
MNELKSTVLDTPLFFLIATLAAYLSGIAVYRKCNQHSLAQPILIGILCIIGLLQVLDIKFDTYNRHVNILNILLGSATVCLAVPIYQNLTLIRNNLRPILFATLVSGAVSSGLAVFLAWLLEADNRILLSLAPKSITTPFAIGVSNAIGGYPSLSAAIVILTGILVAIIATPAFALLREDDPMIRGLAMGMTGHGIATARAFELDNKTGAFSALGMGLMGIYISVTLPYLIVLFRL